MKTQGRLMEIWVAGHRKCVLCSVDNTLEVRLYDYGRLIGLLPCDTSTEALAVATVWRTNPPAWPPY